MKPLVSRTRPGVMALATLLALLLPAPRSTAQDASKPEPKPTNTQAQSPAPSSPTSEPGAQSTDRTADGTREAGQRPVDPAEIEELRRRIEVLAAEVEKLRSGEEEVELTPERRRALGLAPSAAATYQKKQGVSLAGYGELLFENFAGEDQNGGGGPKGSQFDLLRAILYAGYRFNDRFVFNSELEYEHAGKDVSVEFAYLDYLVNDRLTLRGGLLLMPMGLINEFHESNVFLGARRPETERRIIASTWRENGFGVLGSAGRVAYRAYVVNGMNAEGFSADGLRGGRQGGAQARAADLAFVGRLDLSPVPGVFAGVSAYTGGSGQGRFVVNGRELDVDTTIAELHAQAQVRGFDLRGLYARATLDEVAELNRALGLTGRRSIARVMEGGYAQIGYNLLSQYTQRTGLTPYYRFEWVNTQAELAAGFAADSARDGTFHTLGVELRPIYNIVIKTDYQWIRNDARTGRNQFNVNLGYAF